MTWIEINGINVKAKKLNKPYDKKFMNCLMYATTEIVDLPVSYMIFSDKVYIQVLMNKMPLALDLSVIISKFTAHFNRMYHESLVFFRGRLVNYTKEQLLEKAEQYSKNTYDSTTGDQIIQLPLLDSVIEYEKMPVEFRKGYSNFEINRQPTDQGSL